MDALQKLLSVLSNDYDKLEEWLANPQEKSKEWQFDLQPSVLECVETTLRFWYTEKQQLKAMQAVNERSLQKLHEVSRHNKIAFYCTLCMHVIILLFSLLLTCIGIYACCRVEGNGIGWFLFIFGMIGVAYFLLAKPLQSLNEHIGNMVQMEVALSGWFNEMAYWQVFLKNTHIEDKQIVAQAMRDATKWTIMLIENYCTINNKIATLEQDKKDKKEKVAQFISTIKTQTKNMSHKFTSSIFSKLPSKKQDEATEQAEDTAEEANKANESSNAEQPKEQPKAEAGKVEETNKANESSNAEQPKEETKTEEKAN